MTITRNMSLLLIAVTSNLFEKQYFGINSHFTLRLYHDMTRFITTDERTTKSFLHRLKIYQNKVYICGLSHLKVGLHY